MKLLELTLTPGESEGRTTLTFQILEQDDERIKQGDFLFRASDGFKIYSMGYPEIVGDALFLRGGARTLDINSSLVYFASPADRDAYLARCLAALREFAASMGAKLTIDGDRITIAIEATERGNMVKYVNPGEAKPEEPIEIESKIVHNCCDGSFFIELFNPKTKERKNICRFTSGGTLTLFEGAQISGIQTDEKGQIKVE